MIDAGLADAEAAYQRPLEHVVSRAVGTEAHFALDCKSGVIEPGDMFLLCSDGLTKAIEEPEIAWLLGYGSSRGKARRLVDAALLAGGPDNVTAVVVQQATDAEPAAAPPGQPSAPGRVADGRESPSGKLAAGNTASGRLVSAGWARIRYPALGLGFLAAAGATAWQMGGDPGLRATLGGWAGWVASWLGKL